MGDIRHGKPTHDNFGDCVADYKVTTRQEVADDEREFDPNNNKSTSPSPSVASPHRDVQNRRQSLSASRRRRTESSGSVTTSPGQATLVFQDVCVTLGKREILKSVNGLARAGQMMAIMGPSGAGKSTLLNTLTGRTPRTSGHVTLNGHPVDRQIRRKISYVVQQDFFYAHLTLRETLMFATMMRLPDEMPRHEKLRRFQETVDALELNKCLETRMGDNFITGLSGGEKKRASIACELVTNPSMLLLDEPTTGLDAAIANHLMATLERFVRASGKTIVVTIHQPSSQIFHMFSSLLLLSDGEVAYFGPINNVVGFFANQSMVCTPHYNPADFILEQLKIDKDNRERLVRASRVARSHLPDELQYRRPSHAEVSSVVSGRRHSVTISTSPDSASTADRRKTSAIWTVFGQQSSDQLESPVELVAYRKSGFDDPVRSEVQINESDVITEAEPKWPTRFRTQYSVLTRRAFLLARSRLLSKLNFCQILAVAILYGIVYFQIDRSEETAKDRMGVLYVSVVYYSFVAMVDGINLIIDKTGVFRRERSAGMYRLSAYYLSLTTVEIPMTCVLPTMYITVIYWMTGLTPRPMNFFCVWVVLLLNVSMSQGIGVLFGVVIGDHDLSRTIAQSFRVASFLAAGFYNTHMADWFRWTKYISFMYYAFGLMCKIEFVYGPPFKCAAEVSQFQAYCGLETIASNTSSLSTSPPVQLTIPGSEFLSANQLNDNAWYVDLVVLISLSILSRLAAFVVLLNWRRPTT